MVSYRPPEKHLLLHQITTHRFIMMVLLFLFTGIQNNVKANLVHQTTNDTKIKYNYQLIQLPDNTWGYCIHKNKKVFINQMNIPGKPGKKGFASKTDAEKVAQLVIKKLKIRNDLPTVSNEELIQLKIKT